LDIFANASPFQEALEDWSILKEWSKKNNHELVMVSAQRNRTVNPTTLWIATHNFDFKEIHYTHEKWKIDVDILIDDSPKKLKEFKEKSVNSGDAICFKRNWNMELHNSYHSIDRLSDIVELVEKL
jgi:5'(3')-deoxyribonucleotidase